MLEPDIRRDLTNVLEGLFAADYRNAEGWLISYSDTVKNGP